MRRQTFRGKPRDGMPETVKIFTEGYIMRSVVVELKNNKAAVLKPDGSVDIISNKNYTVGQLLDLPEKSRSKITVFMGKYARQTAAAAVFLILSTGLLTANTYAFTTVTMDINPSLSYSLNAFDKVIKMEALNEDGQDIVDAVGNEVKWQKLDKAVSITLNGLESADYIGEETDAVFTVGSHFPRHERLEKEILTSVDDWNRDRKEHGDEKHVNAEAIEATRELRDKARKQNLSPGRVYMEEHKKPADNPGEQEEPAETLPFEDTEEQNTPDQAMPEDRPSAPLSPEQTGGPGEAPAETEKGTQNDSREGSVGNRNMPEGEGSVESGQNTGPSGGNMPGGQLPGENPQNTEPSGGNMPGGQHPGKDPRNTESGGENTPGGQHPGGDPQNEQPAMENMPDGQLPGGDTQNEQPAMENMPGGERLGESAPDTERSGGDPSSRDRPGADQEDGERPGADPFGRDHPDGGRPDGGQPGGNPPR